MKWAEMKPADQRLLVGKLVFAGNVPIRVHDPELSGWRRMLCSGRRTVYPIDLLSLEGAGYVVRQMMAQGWDYELKERRSLGESVAEASFSKEGIGKTAWEWELREPTLAEAIALAACRAKGFQE